MFFSSHYLLSLQRFSAVAFYCRFWWFGALANLTWTRPRLGGLPHLESFTWLTGLPYLADRATRLGELPHLSCKYDQIKWEITWSDALPHLGGLPHLPGVPHLHVNRPLGYRTLCPPICLSLAAKVVDAQKWREGERKREVSLLSPYSDPSRARPQFLVLRARLLATVIEAFEGRQPHDSNTSRIKQIYHYNEVRYFYISLQTSKAGYSVMG